MRILAFACIALLVGEAARADDPPKLELKDGDRVVYLGNAFVERDQTYGYLETLLTAGFPDRAFTFRNLGWSGDTVWGDARARFGTRADGFKHLKDHVLALKPNVILVAYGMNESFAGKAGLAEFEAGLNSLLEVLEGTGAKILLVAPIPHEEFGRPLPDPLEHNVSLGLYRAAIERVAEARKHAYLDVLGLWDRLFHEGSDAPHLTDDGIHPTPYGYHRLAGHMAALLDLPESVHLIERDDSGHLVEGPDWHPSKIEPTPTGIKFEALSRTLPEPPFRGAKKNERPGGQHLVFGDWRPGRYALKIDGQVVHRFSIDAGADEDKDGKARISEILLRGPEIEQVEKLCAAINKKNELYFHRWRPQNETYLLGFRKHEQGNNAVEIPRFDPLVAELEAEIARLKKPVPHSYELIREGAGK